MKPQETIEELRFGSVKHLMEGDSEPDQWELWLKEENYGLTEMLQLVVHLPLDSLNILMMECQDSP